MTFARKGMARKNINYYVDRFGSGGKKLAGKKVRKRLTRKRVVLPCQKEKSEKPRQP